MKKILPYILLMTAVLFLSLGFIQKPGPIQQRRFSEKVNLALRQTGHQLLQNQGDEKSTIPPVEELESGEFILHLECGFDYDALPKILANALETFEIKNNYRVSVRSCESNILVLGYNHWAYKKEGVACGGREQTPECSNIYLSFDNKSNSGSGNLFSILGLGMLGTVLFLQFFQLKKQKEKRNSVLVEKTNFIKIGNSEFDNSNQIVSVSGKKKSLTFRENKLLHFFAIHPNQVLEREYILSNVWEDEGVIVGRSLDVFVSRLRKILKEDESIRLKNIHGVGYRLEV